MRLKPLKKKLTLKKTTVANLSAEEQKKVKGGSGTDNALTCSLKDSNPICY